jgi:hypothetical protein
VRLLLVGSLSGGAEEVVDFAHESFGALFLSDDFVRAFGFQVDVVTDHERNVQSGIVLLDLFAKLECGVVGFIGIDDDKIAVELKRETARLLDAVDDLDDITTPLQYPPASFGKKRIGLDEDDLFVAGGHRGTLLHLVLGKSL